MFLKVSPFKIYAAVHLALVTSMPPTWLTTVTVKCRFSETPRETKIGSRNQGRGEIEGKNVVFDLGKETTFGLSYREF